MTDLKYNILKNIYYFYYLLYFKCINNSRTVWLTSADLICIFFSYALDPFKQFFSSMFITV